MNRTGESEDGLCAPSSVESSYLISGYGLACEVYVLELNRGRYQQRQAPRNSRLLRGGQGQLFDVPPRGLAILTGWVKLVTLRRPTPGLASASGATLLGASWQRCRAHYSVNLMSITPKSAVALGEDDVAFDLPST